MSRDQTAQKFMELWEEQEVLAIQNGFSNNGEVRYTQDQQRGRIVSMTPYTQTQVQRLKQEFL